MVLPVRTQSAPATPSPSKIWGGVGLDGEKWKALGLKEKVLYFDPVRYNIEKALSSSKAAYGG